ncbi:MAG: chemotaxis-specific protein-glutamate methyltransferase CheB [Actinomycetia bacterium]|nr:chemotaxis-specific protein-glutamate methyltransferase CheB [Actinomycetes bacterium]
MSLSKPIRVALIDDSALVRRELRRAISAEPDMEVAGVAGDGESGLALIARTRPDLLVLDLEMGEVSGLDVLGVLRGEYPELPVIVFSALTKRGAVQTVDAITAGARDYLTKPSSLSDGHSAKDVMLHLITKIRALVRDAHVAGERLPGVRPTRNQVQRRKRTQPQALFVGGSTGAPEALAKLLPQLPQSFPVPIVIAIHMPAAFTGQLADSLDRRSALRVRESVSGEPLKPGTVWLAAGGHHLTVGRAMGEGVASLDMNDSPPVNHCRPSVDVLFSSAADLFGSRMVAVVLTGMGNDGLQGAAEIAARGGIVLTQDRASSTVWGMPGAVTESGLADEIVPLDDMATRVQLLCGRSSSGTNR